MQENKAGYEGQRVTEKEMLFYLRLEGKAVPGRCYLGILRWGSVENVSDLKWVEERKPQG